MGWDRSNCTALTAMPDNHRWDCLVGCVVAASFQGVALEGLAPSTRPTRGPRLTLAEMQARADDERT